MDERLRKLDGHASALLDAYLGVRLTYALLVPLLGDPMAELPHNPPRRLQSGLPALRRILFMSCVLDIARLTWDNDKRTPSIANLVAALGDPETVKRLTQAHVAAEIIHSGGDSEEHAAAVVAISAHEAARRKTVEEGSDRIRANWRKLDSHPLKDDFLTLRDQYRESGHAMPYVAY
jgi:hypothetical protein